MGTSYRRGTQARLFPGKRAFFFGSNMNILILNFEQVAAMHFDAFRVTA
jgi:hypothetical protein